MGGSLSECFELHKDQNYVKQRDSNNSVLFISKGLESKRNANKRDMLKTYETLHDWSEK